MLLICDTYGSVAWGVEGYGSWYVPLDFGYAGLLGNGLGETQWLPLRSLHLASALTCTV